MEFSARFIDTIFQCYRLGKDFGPIDGIDVAMVLCQHRLKKSHRHCMLFDLLKVA